MSAERFTAVYERTPSAPPNQDVMTMGCSFVNLTGWSGSGGTSLTDTIRAAVEAAWGAFDTAWKVYRTPQAKWSLATWHDLWPAGPPPHGALRTVTKNSNGTGSPSTCHAPQVAINCTLESASRRHWGRFSLGMFTVSPSSGSFTSPDGTVDPTARTQIATALDTFLEACITGGALPIVYRRPKWQDKEHSVLLQGGEFYPVIGSRVDDVFDIIRRRRWEHAGASQRSRNGISTYVPATYDLKYIDTVA